MRRLVRKIDFNLSNPVLVYTSIWLLVLWLESLRLVYFLIEPNILTLTLIFSNIFTFFFIFVVLSAHFPAKRLVPNHLIKPEILNLLYKFTKKLLAFWALGTVITIIHDGGFPFFWLLIGNTSKNYTNFGIPTFNGLLNAMYMFSLSALFLDYCLRKEKRKLYAIILLLAWSVMLMSRGAFLWIFLELTGVYLLINRISLIRAVRVLLVCFLLILLFGWMGEVRHGFGSGGISTYGLFSEKGQEVFDKLPVGFSWIYLYLTTPINNVIGAIESLQTTYSLNMSVVALFPTVIRSIFFEPKVYALELVSEAYTGATFYAGFLSDFGMAGTILIVAMLQFVVTYFYLSARRGKMWAILTYAVFFQALVLSVFWDTFTSLLTVCQVIFGLYFKIISRRVETSRTLRMHGSVKASMKV